MPSIAETRHVLTAWLTPLWRYERHISAAAMMAGFGIDSYTFGRIDRPMTHVIFCAYLAIAVFTIAIAHVFQSAADDYKEKRDRQFARVAYRWRRRQESKDMRSAAVPARAISDPPGPPSFAPVPKPQASDAASLDIAPVAPISDTPQAPPTPEAQKPIEPAHDWRRTALLAATQFAIGGLSSGFLVFYGRSAAFASSWLFLLVLVGFLIGNEVFKKYHSRLVFSSLLLFFSLYSYAIFVVPVLIRAIGKVPFLLSGAVAVLAFLLFLRLLWAIGRERFRESRWPILLGTVLITVAMNVFYFTQLLPPLPLALSDIGIFHTVKKVGDKYIAV